MMTVKDLRQSGYKVAVKHTRPRNIDGEVASRGGKTVVEITTPEGLDLIGEAQCSEKDNYSKKMGVKIALGRALKVGGS